MDILFYVFYENIYPNIEKIVIFNSTLNSDSIYL
jgi:hypothetical protein